jgi:hypothetical protein
MDRMEIMIIIIIRQCILISNVWLILIKLIQKGKVKELIRFYLNYFFFRINQDLRSWVQDQGKKSSETESIIIPDPQSLTIPSNSVIRTTADSSIQHLSRKVARQTKFVFYNFSEKLKKFIFRIQSESKGQLQPYKTYETNYDDFIHTLDRKNDTLYFISFKRVCFGFKLKSKVILRVCRTI